MNRRQIVLNAVTTSAQIACNAAILFFLYRFLVRAIGLSGLGIWSLVLATTSVVALANQGFSTSIVKFVAKYAARDASADVSALVQTAELSLGIALAIVLLALYPVAKWALALVLPHSSVAAAYAIFPYAVASLWINVTGSVLQAGLAGHELITECNYVDLGGSALYLFLSFAFVPRHGLLGLGYAQLAQAAVCFLALWILLKRRVPLLPMLPRTWSRTLFREMAGYGAHFQLITVSQSIREPVTKALLTKFGGLGMTGLYDLASRLVVTARELLVQSNQVLIPTISSLQERDPLVVPAVYEKSYRLIFYLGVPVFACVVIVSPLVSVIWLGRYEPIFMEFVALLAVGWLVNVLSNPAYVVDLATGALRWVAAGCVLTAILNVVLGVVLGKALGGTAVVAASVSSLIAGYAIIIAAYHIENRIPFRTLVPPQSASILAVSASAIIFFVPLFAIEQASPLASDRIAFGIPVALLMIVASMWMHPMRRRVWNWVTSKAVA
ncbi:MAG: lipopolysaccharide biosynthesis protein [Candidatus Acidiferrales bacterium]